MKIAMTITHYGKGGGIGRYVAELAERFVREHEVHIFSADWDCGRGGAGDGDNDLIFHKTPMVTKPRDGKLPPFGNFIYPPLSILSYLLSTTWKIDAHDFDIVQSNSTDCFFADVFNTMSIHKAWLDVLKDEGHSTVFGRKLLSPGDLVCLALEKYSYGKRKYKKLIACSSSTKRELMQYYDVPEEDIEVIPLGVNLDEFCPLPSPNEKLTHLRKRYGIGEGDVVLIIVATEFHRKGLAELIKALSIIKGDNKKNLKLLVVGGGQNTIGFDYRTFAEQLGLKSSVIFTGRVGNLNAHYNLADIFVFPTKYEGFGIPVVEAMATGLPVVTTNTAAGEDAVEEGKNGFLIENPTDSAEIAEKLSILIGDEGLRKQMGMNARKTAEKFTWDETAKKTLEVYKSIS